MKAYWEYMCDEGHRWVLFKDVAAPEQPAETLCPQGHEAVTLRKGPVADIVETSIRPAAHICDDVTGRLALEHHYYLVLRDNQSMTERMSARTYRWADAVESLKKFEECSAAKAWRLLDQMDG